MGRKTYRDYVMGYIITSVLGVAAWLTHVVVCIHDATWGLLIAGAIFFPVGIVHGIGIWFGFWS